MSGTHAPLLWRAATFGAVYLCLWWTTGLWMPLAVVSGKSMEPTYSEGDLLIMERVDGPLEESDVVVFITDRTARRVVHRVVAVAEDGRGILTKGDNNWVDDYAGGMYSEGEPLLLPEQIESKVRWHVPAAGWPALVVQRNTALRYGMWGALAVWAAVDALGAASRRWRRWIDLSIAPDFGAVF